MSKKKLLVMVVVSLVAMLIPTVAFAVTTYSTQIKNINSSYASASVSVTGKLVKYGTTTGISGKSVTLYCYNASTASWTKKYSITTDSSGNFSFNNLLHTNKWKVSFAGTSSSTTVYKSSSFTFTVTEPLVTAPVMTWPKVGGSFIYAFDSVPLSFAANNTADGYQLYINGVASTKITNNNNATTSISLSDTAPGLKLGLNSVYVVAYNCKGKANSGSFIINYIPPAGTTDIVKANAYLVQQQSMWKYLDGVVVTMGTTPAGREAVAYYSSGKILISTTHTVSIGTILRHEVWHIIDWRDNGVIDWGENIPPKNAADYHK